MNKSLKKYIIIYATLFSGLSMALDNPNHNDSTQYDPKYDQQPVFKVEIDNPDKNPYITDKIGRLPDKPTTKPSEVKLNISGCSTNGGLRLSLATGDFWCSPDKPNPHICGGFYTGFPNSDNPPSNFTNTADCSCENEAALSDPAKYAAKDDDGNKVFVITGYDTPSQPDCLTELYTINVKDIKGNNMVDFQFTHGIDVCPRIPRTSCASSLGPPASSWCWNWIQIIYPDTPFVLPTNVCTPVVPPLINGQCGSANGSTTDKAPITDLCLNGIPSVVQTNATDFTWNCNGSGGGKTDSCSSIKSNTPVLDEKCGTSNGMTLSIAPVTNLCVTGTPTVVKTNAANFTWSCDGLSGGKSDNCMATRNVNGKCGSLTDSFVYKNILNISPFFREYYSENEWKVVSPYTPINQHEGFCNDGIISDVIFDDSNVYVYMPISWSCGSGSTKTSCSNIFCQWGWWQPQEDETDPSQHFNWGFGYCSDSSNPHTLLPGDNRCIPLMDLKCKSPSITCYTKECCSCQDE